ncbi:class I lanthipeptide [Chitinophaga nivalis]|uniref:class I lanthipeptide n=1 Tax=Chitinophaga nivalis TaxID=2991709 RepID=UPI0035307DC1
MKKKMSKKLSLNKIKIAVLQHTETINGGKGPLTLQPSICQCDSYTPCISQNAGIC